MVITLIGAQNLLGVGKSQMIKLQPISEVAPENRTAG